MTSKTIADLNTEADTNLADNTAGDISEADVRGLAKNLADSALNRNDDLGKQSIFVPAGGLVPATTSGAASAVVETATNKHNLDVLDFDASADEYACFTIPMPKSWNEGTLTFKCHWTTSATDTDGVAFGLQAVAIADGDTLDTAYGTAIVVTDAAQSAANDVLISAESSALTVAGSPAAGELTLFRVFRDVSDAADTMTEDARLIGVEVFYTINALKDD